MDASVKPRTNPQPSLGVIEHQVDEMAQDCHGENFFAIDRELQSLLELHVPRPTLEAVLPHLERLGALAGDRLDELAYVADQNPPRLHARDRQGRRAEWIEYHPAFRELERVAYEEFGIHAIGRRGGLLGTPEVLTPLLKYVCQYLFVQAEFGLMCPVAMTDSCAHVLQAYGDEQVKRLYLPGLLANDSRTLLKGGQMMTERQAGSDVGAILTRAEPRGDHWLITGEKWFCSASDADIVMVLARSDPASTGTKGLSLYAVPRVLPDGTRNHYVIRNLKDKLGTRSIPTGEIDFEGAIGHLVGPLGQGLKVVLNQVNMSRLSHGVRAASMMRRCLNEAMAAAHTRAAFGQRLIDLPMVQHELLDMRLPAEQALSMLFATANWLDLANKGDQRARRMVRILTPVLKLGACRDNLTVATAAMELRGGNGFIADYVNERLVRDAHAGVLWEGTSNIIALDLVTRAFAKDRAHIDLLQWLTSELEQAQAHHPEIALLSQLREHVSETASSLEALGQRHDGYVGAIELGMSFYHAVSAALLACEGTRLQGKTGSARRLLYADLVFRRRSRPGASEALPKTVISAALSSRPLDLQQLSALLHA